jgi:TonB family protein
MAANDVVAHHLPRRKLIRASTLAVLLSSAALGQSTPSESETSGPAGTVQFEKVIAPALVTQLALTYPPAEASQRTEGWVQLGMMVDAKGKPYEVAVVGSSGDTAFERAAVSAVEGATYKPGLVNGKPTESATGIKIRFVLDSTATGARPDFVQHYVSLQRAAALGDKAEADVAMKSLSARNLYEEAYFGLASYLYARQWGDEAQQLAGLRQAIAYESHAKYVSQTEFRAALVQCLALEARLHHYAEAQTLWVTLQGSGADPATLAKIRLIMSQVDHIRISDVAYDVAGAMPEGRWTLGLYKQNFRFKVDQGHISYIRLRCSKGFEGFAFDSAREYNVDTKYGDCSMDLAGDRGTQFTVTQF